MKIYRFLWMTGWSFIAVIGTGMSMISLPWLGLLMLTLLGSALGLLFLTMRHHWGHFAGDHEPARSVATGAAHAGAGALSVLAIAGLSPFLGALTLFIITVMAIASPCAVRKLLHGIQSTNSSSTQAATLTSPTIQSRMRSGRTESRDLPVLESVRGLSDAGLCRAWRTTYLPIREARDAATLEQLSLFRKACLDEIERRNAHAFNAWLNAGARASGDPTKFLTAPGDEGQTPRR